MTYEVGGILFLSLALQLPYIKHDFVLAQEDKVTPFNNLTFI
jgi:hypothetical protein